MKVPPEIHLSITLLFLVFEFYFMLRRLKRVGGFKGKRLIDEKGEAFFHAILGPWETKYHWGGIVQLILLFLIIYLQF